MVLRFFYWLFCWFLYLDLFFARCWQELWCCCRRGLGHACRRIFNYRDYFLVCGSYCRRFLLNICLYRQLWSGCCFYLMLLALAFFRDRYWLLLNNLSWWWLTSQSIFGSELFPGGVSLQSLFQRSSLLASRCRKTFLICSVLLLARLLNTAYVNGDVNARWACRYKVSSRTTLHKIIGIKFS